MKHGYYCNQIIVYHALVIYTGCRNKYMIIDTR